MTLALPAREASHAGHEVRDVALDGLRGLAALVVVVAHVVLATSPTLADAYRTASPPTSGFDAALYGSPLHLVWAGQDAVLVFFVLSGYVLALPAVRRGRAWLDRSYLPRRIVRLYLPVWAALAVAACLHLGVSHHRVAGATWWLDAHAASATVRNAVALGVLVGPASGWAFTSVLWSLRWEVLFSLALPAVLLVPLALRRHRSPVSAGGQAAVAVLALVAIGVGAGSGNGYLAYLPVFVLGSLVAFHQAAAGTLAHRVPTWLLASLGGVALVGTEECAAVGVAQPAGQLLSVVGAVALVVAATRPGSFSETLATRPLRWLGARSFSLYLVHEPVVVAIAFTLGGRPATPVLLAVALPASLLLAEAFWRGVEAPSIVLARRVGRAARTAPLPWR